MPIVTVQMWTGRTSAEKKALTRAIADAMVQHARAKPETLNIIIQEVPKENWTVGRVTDNEKTS